MQKKLVTLLVIVSLFITVFSVAAQDTTMQSYPEWFECPEGSEEGYFWADGAVGIDPERPANDFIVRNGYNCITERTETTVTLWSKGRQIEVTLDEKVIGPRYPTEHNYFWANFSEIYQTGDKVITARITYAYFDNISSYYENSFVGTVVEPTGWLLNFYDSSFQFYVPVQLENSTLIGAMLRADTRFFDETWTDPSYAIEAYVEGAWELPFAHKIGDTVNFDQNFDVHSYEYQANWWSGKYEIKDAPASAVIKEVFFNPYYGETIEICFTDNEGIWCADPSIVTHVNGETVNQ